VGKIISFLLIVSASLSAANIIEKIPLLQTVRIAYVKVNPSYVGKPVNWKIYTYTIDEANGAYTVVGDTLTGTGDSVKVLLIKYASKYTYYKIFAFSEADSDSLELQVFSKGSMQKYLYRSPVFPAKPIPVHIFLPGGFSTNSPIVVAMHGVDRNAYNYGLSWTDFATANNWVVLAPEFNAADWPSDAYALGNMFTGNDGAGALNSKEKWSFTIVSDIERTMCRGLGMKDSSYTLWGHSAGGQFVHRMILFAYDSLIRRAIPANSGWYTAPDSTIAYPWGTKHPLLSISFKNLIEFASREMVIMRGTADTIRDSNLNTDPLSDAQGRNRYQRAGYFFQKGKDTSPNLKWKMIDVVGSGHEYQKMAVAAGQYINSVTGAYRVTDVIPQTPQLRNYPNPFNPSTEIVFSIERASRVSVTIYNILGQEIRTIVDDYLLPGEYQERFDGSSLSNGMYFCVLRKENMSSAIKLLLMK
jgi:hypothetical protein